MAREIDAVKIALLARGLDDWVHIAEVVSVTRHAMFGDRVLYGYPDNVTMSVDQLARSRGEWLVRSEREALPLGIAAIKELLRDGLVRLGDTANGNFEPWGGSLEDIEYRIDQAVQEAQFPLLPGHLFWLENTPSGDEIAGQASVP